VRQLTGVQMWLVTAGRVLAAFGLGVIAAIRYPDVVGRLGLPAAIAGVVCLLLGATGLGRRGAARDEGPGSSA